MLATVGSYVNWHSIGWVIIHGILNSRYNSLGYSFYLPALAGLVPVFSWVSFIGCVVTFVWGKGLSLGAGQLVFFCEGFS